VILVELRTDSEQATRDLAARLAESLLPGDVIALVGELGAGKTRFVQGLAHGLGVPEESPVTSPTFTFLAVYNQGRLPLYHCDFYRIANERELECIGVDEYLWGEGVSVVEWADRAIDRMPESALWVQFSFVGDGRELTFRAANERWRPVVERLRGDSAWR
jgi:tRNA threonylcarbamoyladenosine biosynthesis protein TsaE